MQIFKEYTQLDLLKGENEFTQISHKALDGMKNYISKFLLAIHEVFKASKDLNLHMLDKLKKINEKDLKLQLKDMQIILRCALRFQLDFELDIQNLYMKYPKKNQKINYLKNLFTFYFFKFQEILKYVFLFEYRNYCSRFGHFDEVEEYWPTSSEMNSISAGPVIKSYYHMRLFTAFNYYPPHDRTLQESLTNQISLKCDHKVLSKVFIEFKNARNEMLDYVNVFRALLESKNIQLDESLTKPVLEENEILVDFFYHSFRTLLNQIPDEHKALKRHLEDHYGVLRTFFEEVQGSFYFIKFYNMDKNFKILKPYFSKKMQFELHFQENHILFVEWGPALKSVKENEKILIKELLLIMKRFTNFQQNYIKKVFSELWLESCGLNSLIDYSRKPETVE
ncbi:hypothetical protein HMI54_005146 [Coelomomyces lativittatus]|nr:hypothetical protein HMI54_005146 [Coelomomyces lativittatus]